MRASNPASHLAADRFIEILHSFDHSLTLPYVQVTREGPGGKESTTDLVFTTSVLLNQIIECQARRGLDQGSDHFPISTEIALEPRVELERKQRFWKEMDTIAVLERAQHLNLPS